MVKLLGNHNHTKPRRQVTRENPELHLPFSAQQVVAQIYRTKNDINHARVD
jgi:hypothetical protein